MLQRSSQRQQTQQKRVSSRHCQFEPRALQSGVVLSSTASAMRRMRSRCALDRRLSPPLGSALAAFFCARHCSIFTFSVVCRSHMSVLYLGIATHERVQPLAERTRASQRRNRQTRKLIFEKRHASSLRFIQRNSASVKTYGCGSAQQSLLARRCPSAESRSTTI